MLTRDNGTEEAGNAARYQR